MKLCCHFEAVNMGDEIIIVPVGIGANLIQGVVKVNKEGLEIFELLESDISEDDIIIKLIEKYDSDPETISMYVHKFIELLKNHEIIIE